MEEYNIFQILQSRLAGEAQLFSFFSGFSLVLLASLWCGLLEFRRLQ